MPYIGEEWRRAKINEYVEDMSGFIKSKGDLNYAISQLVGCLILRDGIGYTTISNWMDAIHGAEVECRRRILDKYEDYKILENGDVPSFELILERMKQQEE